MELVHNYGENSRLLQLQNMKQLCVHGAIIASHFVVARNLQLQEGELSIQEQKEKALSSVLLSISWRMVPVSLASYVTARIKCR